MTTEENTPMFISMVNSNNKYFIPCSEDGVILAYKTLQEGINDWEKVYHRAHEETLERSSSACIHYIFFSPVVVKIDNLESIRETVIVTGDKMMELKHVSGRMLALECNGPHARDLYESGERPRLVHDGQSYGQMNLF